ncbi:MAG: hypothetical protein FJW39_18325 [Acidobacteria bacterium]|nr:hypothetical protein [Acidobacteriota bacterium]
MMKFLAALSAAASVCVAQSLPTIDGSVEDPFWQGVPAQRLAPAEAGVPADLGGQVRVAFCGRSLCFSATLPEPGGRIVARALGRNPVWETDALESPPVEDRIEFTIEGSVQPLKLSVNPFGAYRIERNGRVEPGLRVRAAARVTGAGWTMEAALPLDAAGRLRVERIRSRRPLSPEMRWASPVEAALKSGGEGEPTHKPPELGNTEPPLEIGRTYPLPPMPAYLSPVTPSWSDPAWDAIPSFTLPRNEPYPRKPRFPTEVKWTHDGSTLALLVRIVEQGQLTANSGGRDVPLDSDDHFAIRLATDGAAALEIVVNSAGAIRDRRIRDLRTLRAGGSDWNARIDVRTRIEHGAWILRMNVPLKDCAEALGEDGVPSQWRVLVSRHRAPRPGEAAEISALPPVGSDNFYGALRYRRVVLRDEAPGQVARVEAPAAPQGELARGLASLESRVWNDFERRHRRIRNMVRDHQQKRLEKAVLDERHAWDAIRSRSDWESFRAERLRRLRESAGDFPGERVPLDVRVSATRRGKGYQLDNLVFQSRPGFYVTANLYRPENVMGPMPAIVIMHSFHYPKTQGELHDVGEIWARAGCTVLIPERLGFGERVETTPWHRQAYGSRFTFRKQLNLTGDSFIGWMAWDLIRSVDLLVARPDVDPRRIIMIGAVAGGQEPAALAAALDDRIAAIIPYNYDHGRVRLGADFPGELTRQINMSFVVNAVAPRRYVRASEFAWEGAEQSDFPELWVDAWERSKKVWSLAGVPDNLASIQAYGLIRLSMERVSHCFSVGPQHLAELHPIVQRWFGIPLPSAGDLAILPDSQLSVNPYREEARRQEALRRRPASELVSVTPALSANLPRKPLHQVAREDGRRLLATARANRAGLRAKLAAKLGDIEPAGVAKVERSEKRQVQGISVEAVALNVEAGIHVPMLILRPAAVARPPVVVGLTHGGKDRFLKGRPEMLAALLAGGVAVCLPDLRGTGETAPEPDWNNEGGGITDSEQALGNSPLGARLKDLRAVIRHLRTRTDLDARRLAVWGEGFAPVNSKPLILDELEMHGGPSVQYHSEPLGATLALLAGLYEDVPIVAARHGLASYLSLLDSAFTYTPADAIVHGVLRVGDIADITAALAPRAVLLNAMVNGRNELVGDTDLQREFSPAAAEYRRAGSANRLRMTAAATDPVPWLLESMAGPNARGR